MYQVEEILKLVLHNVQTLWHHNLFSIAGNQIAVSNILVLIILLLFGIKYSKKLSSNTHNYIISKLECNDNTANNLGMLIICTIRIIYIIIAMALANIPISSFAFIGGALAFGLGFGSQTLITNFISGIIVMIEQPIKIGDIVEIKGAIGKVVSIGIRCVIIKTPANHSILIPTSTIILNNITNWTLNNDIIKYQIEVILPRIDNASSLVEQLRLTIQQLDFIASTEDVHVFLTKVESSNITFLTRFTINIKDNQNFEHIKNVLNITLYSNLKEYNCTLNHLEYAKI